MSNHLAHETSPYLLQHASNPVDWYPWGPEALDKARAEDKPIFLSIGYAACHWCHVMAHESFEDPATAAILNAHFVNIKVDREERPDLDGIYMQAVVAMTGQGGWPMSVFLTPDGQPFYGGTYFPPARRYNMPSFQEVLQTIARLWREDRPRLLESGQQICAHLQQTSAFTPATIPLSAATLDQAAMALAQAYDWPHGGWGAAPKFPQPMAIEFLLRKATRGDRFAHDIATHALRAMAKGGMYDVVGGGFARYSTDDRWLAPHFEKMLYDNAQLALAYLHGYLVTGEAQFRRVCQETLDFVARELTHPAGGFYSSLDADSEGEEGKFYLWTAAELRAALDPAEYEFFSAAYDVSENGNFEGRNVLQRRMDDAALGEKFRLEPEAATDKLSACHARLLAARSQRTRPATDDKVLTAWNGLMLRAFAEAARYLKVSAAGDRESRATNYKTAAIRNAEFLLTALRPGARLLRAWRNGQARHNAYLEDYAALILGLLALYQTAPDPRWFSAALGLAEELAAHFHDPDGGFFDTRADHETLLIRPKDLQDNATPSGNALAAEALLQLAAFTGNGNWRALAETMLAGIQNPAARYPTAFAHWLCALDFALGPVQEVAILGAADHPQTQALTEALWAGYRPRLVAAIANATSAPPGSPALLEERSLLNGLPIAYICYNFTCQQPVNTPDELLSQIGAKAL
jgi:hypothetical protein